MNPYRYWLTHSCPNCGVKDERDMWLGARMHSSCWGHPFKCCSDSCGQEFKPKYDSLVRNKEGRKKLRELWEKLEGEAEHRLCGVPYEGYPWRK